MRYSDDSGLCLAAFHSGTLSPEGGNFLIKISKGISDFTGDQRNGIMSKSKKGDIASPSVEFI